MIVDIAKSRTQNRHLQRHGPKKAFWCAHRCRGDNPDSIGFTHGPRRWDARVLRDRANAAKQLDSVVKDHDE